MGTKAMEPGQVLVHHQETCIEQKGKGREFRHHKQTKLLILTLIIKFPDNCVDKRIWWSNMASSDGHFGVLTEQ